MKVVKVSVQRDVNKDGSITFGLRWRVGGGSKLAYRRVLRTEPSPSRDSRAKWEREVAEARLDKERELNGDARQYVTAIKMGDAADAYVGWCESNRSPSTTARVDRVTTHVIGYFQGTFDLRNVGSVSMAHVARYRDYLDERGLSASTINCYLSDLSAWLGWCVKEGYSHHNPVAGVNRPTVEQTRAAVPLKGADDLWRLLDHLANPVRRSTVGLIAVTGVRIGEGASLMWDDWDEPLGVLTIRRQGRMERTKRHFRCLPVASVGRSFLEPLRHLNSGGPYILGSQGGHTKLTSQVNTWLKPFGVAPKHLRQWFRSSLETLGCEWYEVDDLLGHRTSRVRASYTSGLRDGKDLEGATRIIEKLDAWLLDGRDQRKAEERETA